MGKFFGKPVKEADEPANHDADGAHDDDADGANPHGKNDELQISLKDGALKDPVKWTEDLFNEDRLQAKHKKGAKKKGAKKGHKKDHKKGAKKGHGGHEHKDKDIPADWEAKCQAHYVWCEAFLKKIIKKKKEGKLFAHKKRPKLTAVEKQTVKDECKKEKGAKKRECIKFRTIELQLWDDHNRPKMHRMGRESQDVGVSLWLAMGGLFLLLLLGVVAYFFVSSRGKGARGKGAGKGSLVKGVASKSSKGKSLRSKVGKSKGSKTSNRSKQTVLSAASKGKKRSSKNLRSKSRRSRRSKK